MEQQLGGGTARSISECVDHMERGNDTKVKFYEFMLKVLLNYF